MFNVQFIIACLILAVVPGVGVAICASAGVTGSKTKLFAATLGCVLCVVPYLIANVLGASQWLFQHPICLDIIRSISGIYLFIFAIYIIKSWNIKKNNLINSSESFVKILNNAFRANLLNPKIIVFSFAITPDFINPSSGVTDIMELCIFFSVIIFLSWYCYGYITYSYNKYILEHERVTIFIIYIFAVFEIIFSIKILIDVIPI